MNINRAQLVRLQTLYSQFERHTLDSAPGRNARLEWASQQCGRAIASFSDLTVEEGRRLIDTLQGILGVKAPNQSPRRRMQRKSAEKAGTEGRRDQKHAETTMVSPEDLARLQKDLDRLGWDEFRLKRFLESPRSPLRGRTTILTLSDANKVHWALKHIPVQKERLAAS